MNIYSYYYGASAGSGIGIRALSPQLENHPILSDLKDLSSLHALEATGHESEMLSYLLRRNGFGILGLSYIEPPKSSGYGRSAPCGLQYVVSEAEMNLIGAELGGIVNFIDFQKPSSPFPAPQEKFPLNESGYSFHNSVSVLRPLVDSLVRVALSGQKEILLIALPKGKNSEYATARYTIAEALNYLPVSVRHKIRFFTGLPVGEGVTDPLAGFDNAVKYNANVVFCPSEYYEKLRGYRTFIGLDMNRPSDRVGAFAEYVTQTLTPSEAINHVVSLIPGEMTYSSLNQAAQKLLSGESLPLVDQLKEELENSKKLCWGYKQELDRKKQEIAELKKIASNQQPYVPQDDNDGDDPDEPQGRSALSRILLVCAVILLMALTGLASWLIATKVHTGSFFPKKETAVIAVKPTATPEAIVQDSRDTDDQGQRETVEAVTNADGKAAETDAAPSVTDTPTAVPTDAPTAEPTAKPTADPTAEPTAKPTADPTVKPAEVQGGQAEDSYVVKDAEETEPENKTPEDTSSGLGVNNRYGRTTFNVNLRKGNNKKAELIRELPKGTYVWMRKTENNEAGEQWTEVCVDGTFGYIMTKYLNMLSQEESNQYNAMQSTPVPVEMYAKQDLADGKNGQQ